MAGIERVQHAAWTAPYRPQPLWVPVGALTGVGTGAVAGAVLLAVWWRSDPTHAAEIGLWYGGIVGGVIGLVAGVVLTFAAGSHLARPVARDRAFAVATLVTALPAVLLSLPFMVHPFPFFSLVLATLVSVLAGGIARGLARAL